MITVDVAQASERILKAKKILLTCHRGPDGDSVGSLSALATLLRDRNIEATLYCPDLVPRYLKWLPHAKSFIQALRKKSRYDLTIVVDCGDKKLLGDSFPEAEVTGELLVIDHHASGEAFGDYYLCDKEASSVGVLVARIAEHLGWELTKDASLAIYLSMVADTGSFRYSNTNAEALKLAAKIVEQGLNPWTVSERLGERGSLSRYRLLSQVLGAIEVIADGKVAIVTVTNEMVKAAKAHWEDTEGFVNYARAIEGVDCGILFSPSKYGGIRVSLRSKGQIIDAGALCKSLGGGGHVGAAGCTLDGELADVQQRVSELVCARVKEHMSSQAE